VETIYYAYAVDEQGHLQGVFSLRDMALAQPGTPLAKLLKRDAEVQLLRSTGCRR